MGGALAGHAAGIALACVILLAVEDVWSSFHGKPPEGGLRRTVAFSIPLLAIVAAVWFTRDSRSWLVDSAGIVIGSAVLVAVHRLVPAARDRIALRLSRPAGAVHRRLNAFDRWFSPGSSRPALDELDPRRHTREP